MYIDFLTAVHLVVYPLITGVLLVGFIIALQKGNRWVLITGPSFVFMFLLTVETHLNYQSYLQFALEATK